MSEKPTKSDLKRVAWFEKVVKNINQLLKNKSVEEINSFFDEQDKILKYISIENLKTKLLKNSKELRNTALNSSKNFDSIIEKLKNIDIYIRWKSIDELNIFFDEIDKSISSIPDLKMRQTLNKQSKEQKDRKIQHLLISDIEKTIDELSTNPKIAWNNPSQIDSFFSSLNKNIHKINDMSLKTHLLYYSNILKDNTLSSII